MYKITATKNIGDMIAIRNRIIDLKAEIYRLDEELEAVKDKAISDFSKIINDDEPTLNNGFIVSIDGDELYFVDFLSKDSVMVEKIISVGA